MDDTTRFQKLVQFRVPESLSGMIETAAEKHLQSKSEYVRQALLAGLRADGFDVPAAPAHDAGTLYDARDGLGCYALVSGGRVLQVVNYSAEPDLADKDHHPAGYVPQEGDAWLPIVHVDSEPYDAALHWRLSHIVRIEADRVVREFPVVAKSLEFA